MKTPGQLLAELLNSPDNEKEEKRSELENATVHTLETLAPPGTKITVNISGFDKI